MHDLFFPEKSLYLTALPKNASTSIKGFMLRELRPSVYEEITNSRDFHIACRKHFGAAKGARLLTGPNPRETRHAVSMLILRNPAERLVSAWLEKFLSVNINGSLHFWELTQRVPELGLRLQPKTMDQALAAFTSFVDAVSKDERLLMHTHHWAPQTRIFNTKKKYDIIDSVESMSSFRSYLRENFGGLETSQGIFTSNRGYPDLARYLISQDSMESLQALYWQDFAYMDRHNLNFSVTNLTSINETSAKTEFEKVTQIGLRNRESALSSDHRPSGTN